jgi:hypothetical protein
VCSLGKSKFLQPADECVEYFLENLRFPFYIFSEGKPEKNNEESCLTGFCISLYLEKGSGRELEVALGEKIRSV